MKASSEFKPSEEFNERLSAYPSAREVMKERSSDPELEIFDALMKSRFIGLTSFCLEIDLPSLDKEYIGAILQYHQETTKNPRRSQHSSEVYKYMYHVKSTKPELLEEIYDDIKLMIELYEVKKSAT